MSVLDKIDALLDDDAFAWAFPTLCGIRETISKSGGISTPKQEQAVENIANAISARQRADATGSPLPSDRFKGSRRYEGFRANDKRPD